MIAGVLGGLLVGLPIGVLSENLWWALVPCLILAIVGLVDDFRGLSAGLRLMLQGVTCLLLVMVIPSAAAGIVMTGLLVLYAIYIVNATNFMDGINGITALTATVAGLYFALVASLFNAASVQWFASCLAAVSLGFFLVNSRGRLFLGDVGSYFLGAVLAGLSIWTFTVSGNAVLASAPLLLYIVDTVTALIMKVSRGQPVFSAHKTHVYQRLTAASRSHVQVSSLIATVNLVVSAGAFVAYVNEWPWYLYLPAIAVAIGYLGSPWLVGRFTLREGVG